METQLHYDISGSNQLSFKLRQRIATKLDVELKAKGLFNTVTGKLEYNGTLKKYISMGSKKKSDSTPLRIGLGVSTCSSEGKPEDPQLTISACKQFALLDGPNTLLSARAHIDVDPRQRGGTIQMARKATIKASHKALNFTNKQDLKLTVGLDVDWPSTAKEPTADVYVQVRENNWALNYRHKGWSVTYDL